MSFSLIPPGEFDMTPNYRVRISQPFQMGCHEVTLAQFRAFVKDTGYQTSVERSGKGDIAPVNGNGETRPEFTWQHESVAHGEDYPVGQVSWNDAVAYCQWLTQQTGRVHRLPSEAEWRWSCRAGSNSQYPFGDDASLIPKYAWFIDNAKGTSHPVGQKRPNAWGLYDMLMNIAEHTHDWSSDKPLQGTVVDPFGPTTGNRRSICGSGFIDPAIKWNVPGAYWPDSSHYHFGFRVVRAVEIRDDKVVPPNAANPMK